MDDETRDVQAGSSADGPVELRTVQRIDLERVVTLNEAAVPAVNSVPEQFFGGWLEAAGSVRRDVDCAGEAEPLFLAAQLPGPGEAESASATEPLLGFVLALPPGCAYESINYRWFCERYPAFLYVDRIVVDGSRRGLGLGRRLYDGVVEEARRRDLERVCCEVNLKPRNEGSLRFHSRYGFREVGRQATEGGAKEVSLQVLELPTE